MILTSCLHGVCLEKKYPLKINKFLKINTVVAERYDKFSLLMVDRRKHFANVLTFFLAPKMSRIIDRVLEDW